MVHLPVRRLEEQQKTPLDHLTHFEVAVRKAAPIRRVAVVRGR